MNAANRHDLRLAPLALGCWATALLALRTDMRVALVLAGAGLLLLGAVLCWCPVQWRWITAAGLLGVVCAGAVTAAQLSTRDAPELSDLIARKVTAQVELTVRDDPKLITGSLGSPPTWLIPARLDRVPGLLRHVDARVVVLASHERWRSLLPGQSIVAEARFARARGGDLRAALLSAVAAPTAIGPPPWWQTVAGRLRAGLQRACDPLDPAPGGLLPGLVVGDVSRLDPEVTQDFRDVGMTHLTAVSGSNLAVIAGCVLLLARWCRAGPHVSAALCLVALVGFVVLARPSPSVLRAAAMAGVGLLALSAGRLRSAVPALSATVTVLVLIDPELAVDAGFALSVLATGGLLLLAPGIRDSLRRRGVPGGVAEALAIPISAQLACAPVIAGLSGTVSLTAIPANLLAAPAIAPATIAGVVAAILSPLWSPAAEFAAWLGSWPAWWLVTVAHTGSGLPAGAIAWPGGSVGGILLAVCLVLALAGLRHKRVRTLSLVVGVSAMLGSLPVRVLAPAWPPRDWIVVACDVGQGDATILNLGGGSALVVDAGPSADAMDACLRRLEIRTVRLLMISHFHVDHIGGVAGVFRGRRVDGVTSTAWPEPRAGREAVLQLAQSRGVRSIAAQGFAEGEVMIRVLPAASLYGTRSDPNNNSLVLLATVRGIRILLTGDAETEQQQLLAESGVDLRADVLKLPHHGSSFQDSRFLGLVGATVALVSVGAGNDYGHPNPSVLAGLRRSGVRVLRTDESGDIAVVKEASGLAVVRRDSVG